MRTREWKAVGYHLITACYTSMWWASYTWPHAVWGILCPLASIGMCALLMVDLVRNW